MCIFQGECLFVTCPMMHKLYKGVCSPIITQIRGAPFFFQLKLSVAILKAEIPRKAEVLNASRLYLEGAFLNIYVLESDIHHNYVSTYKAEFYVFLVVKFIEPMCPKRAYEVVLNRTTSQMGHWESGNWVYRIEVDEPAYSHQETDFYIYYSSKRIKIHAIVMSKFQFCEQVIFYRFNVLENGSIVAGDVLIPANDYIFVHRKTGEDTVRMCLSTYIWLKNWAQRQENLSSTGFGSQTMTYSLVWVNAIQTMLCILSVVD